jgi:ABC-2 type transport system ATP-binding protein
MTEPILSVRGLSKHYAGFALSDVSLEIPPGFVMGLIGPNGAGKTTTLKSILGVLRRDSGEVCICGLDPQETGAAARACIGFVHDEPRFPRYLTLRAIAGTIGRFYERWDDTRFRQLAAAFDLPLRKRFGSLSRGMRMKFALALALSHHAQLLVLDEPTTGLDPVFRRDLLDTLQGILEDERTSVLFSTHITGDLDRIADFVTLLQNGKVVFSEAKDSVLERWALIKGGPELAVETSDDLFYGLQRGPHGFEAISDDAAAVRRRFGDSVLIERPTLEEIVLLTSAGDADAALDP